MSDNLKIFAASTVPEWVSDSFPTIRIVLLVLIVLLSIALVITVLFQSSNDGNNINAVTGGSTDTFYGKHRSQSLESILKRITVILAIVIAVLAVLFFVSVAIYNGN